MAVLIVALLAFLILAPIAMYQMVYGGRVYLGVESMGVDLGGYSAEEAKIALTSQFAQYAQTDLVLRYDGKEWRTTPGAFGIRFDGDATARRALQVGRAGGWQQGLGDQIGALQNGSSISPVLGFDSERQSTVMASIAQEIDRPMVNASLVVGADGTVQMVASQVGRKLDMEETVRRIEKELAAIASPTIDLAVVETPPRVVEAQLAAARASAERILSAPLTIAYERESVVLDRDQLTGMLYFRQEGDQSVAELDEKPLSSIVAEMAKRVNREPRDARFTFQSGQLEIVTPSEDGVVVDVPASVQEIRRQSLGDQRTVALVAQTTPPNVQSSDIDKIVLEDKLIEASSVYGDGSADRQHNIRLAVSRLNGQVIAPGETFSLNKALGPTDLADGYRMGWGIINTPDGHQTVPAEAGGICQVATVLFQAVFWTGLRIDQRTEHLYWIARYGAPPLGRQGLDATVDGSGSEDTLDFKFTNNTPNWIAIESYTKDKDMFFVLHGVKPSWTVEVRDPVITNVVKTDRTIVRELDPNMRPGQEVWVEVPQDGFDAFITRIVREGDRVLEEYVVKSHYKPARHVVRHGPTPTPTPTPEPEETPTPSPEDLQDPEETEPPPTSTP